MSSPHAAIPAVTRRAASARPNQPIRLSGNCRVGSLSWKSPEDLGIRRSNGPPTSRPKTKGAFAVGHLTEVVLCQPQ